MTFFPEKEDVSIFVYALKYMFTLDHAKYQYFNMQKVRTLRAEHIEVIQAFHIVHINSSVYRVFWPSDRVVNCNISYLDPRRLVQCL